VRGFTRDVRGKKHFIDHKINSIQNFLSRDTRERYQLVDVNVHQENLFHTKMRLKDLALDDYMFGGGEKTLNAAEKRKISRQVEHEIMEIFSGRNLPKQ
jgi:S-adenosylmethionine decarboxylase